MQILRHAEYRHMPWKNGMGITEEVIAFPDGSDVANFGWRLSIAHVGVDGPFSVFADIDRTIALLDGTGLALDLPESTVELTPGGDPFDFSGDLSISSRNKAGPTIDLNIMTRRGQYRHSMRRISPGKVDIVRPGTLLVFNADARVKAGQADLAIDRFDTLLTEPSDGPLTIEARPSASIYLIEIEAAD